MDERNPAEEQSEEAAVAQRLLGVLLQNGKETKTLVGFETSSGVPSQIHREDAEPEWDAASVSSSSLMDTCCPSISSGSSSSSLSRPRPRQCLSSSSSSSCPVPALPQPWLSSVELSAVLTTTKLTLDVYQGGAAGLPHLWRSVPEQLSRIRYLRLGSEDEDSLKQALEVLHCLPHLRSLAIRGNDMFIRLSQGQMRVILEIK